MTTVGLGARALLEPGRDLRTLRGRRSECEVLDGLLGAVRDGESPVYVIPHAMEELAKWLS